MISLVAYRDVRGKLIILVDAYNVLRTVAKQKTISSQQLRQFINISNAYAQQKQHTLLLVFDGGPFLWPTKEQKSKLLWIIYAGQKQTADDYIKEYIQQNKARDILLASDDRQLCAFAATCDKISIGSADFFVLLKEATGDKKQKKQAFQKAQKLPGKQTLPALDLLMQEAAQKPMMSKQEVVNQQKTDKLKKHERRLMKKIQKL